MALRSALLRETHMKPTVIQQDAESSRRGSRGHTRAKDTLINIERPGRLRVANLLALLNVSHSTLYAGIKSGRYPVPDGKDGKLPYWYTATIRPLLGSSGLSAIDCGGDEATL